MKRIVIVQKIIQKSDGPLTSDVIKFFNKIKEAASECSVDWNGIPCKHAIVAIHDMADNGNKLTRQGGTVTCSNSKGIGHNKRGCKGIGSSGGQMFDMPTTEPVGSQLVASQPVASQPVSRQTRSRGPVASQPVSSQTMTRKQVARKPVQASQSSQPASGKRPASQINEPASQASQSLQPASQASRLPTSPMKRTKMTACRLTPDS
ncbi:hypothetical protein Tco_1060377 [Tanacetum coccineum]